MAQMTRMGHLRDTSPQKQSPEDLGGEGEDRG